MRSYPELRVVFLFELVECVRVAQRQADVVEALEQAIAAEWIDGETRREPLVVAHRVFFERDGQLVVVALRCAVEQRLHLLLGQRDEQNAVLAGVRVEDVGEGWRDDAAEAVIGQRPRSVFSRGPAAKVARGDENLRALVARIVELKARVLAPVEEQKITVAGALDA